MKWLQLALETHVTHPLCARLIGRPVIFYADDGGVDHETEHDEETHGERDGKDDCQPPRTSHREQEPLARGPALGCGSRGAICLEHTYGAVVMSATHLRR